MTRDERLGLILATTGFATLSFGDAVVKTAAGEWPAHAFAALRFVIGASVLSLILLKKEGAGAFVPVSPWLQIARGACLALATVFFFSAIHIMPLAEAMAIAFLAPVLTQVLAGLLLNEEVRRSVYGVSCIALIGVVIVLRPNLAELGLAAFLPLLSATFFALLMIANRASLGQGSSLSMQVFVAVVCAPVLIVISAGLKVSGIQAMDYSWPAWDVVARCALVALTATTAHWLVYIGTSKAGAAQVAPAIYVQMIVAIIMGWWWFNDRPDVYTLGGAGLIIAAGLYLWRDGLKADGEVQSLSRAR